MFVKFLFANQNFEKAYRIFLDPRLRGDDVKGSKITQNDTKIVSFLRFWPAFTVLIVF